MAPSRSRARHLDTATRVTPRATALVSYRPAAEVYLDVATPIALRQVLENVGRPTGQKSPLTGQETQTLKGGVIAAATDNPDYRFIWDRDGAIVMRALVAHTPEALADYVAFSRGRQARVATEVFDPKTLKPAPGFEWAERWLRKDASHGLGEPRELPNGGFDPFHWGRPQTDGPALRALTLIDVLGEPIAPALREQVIATLRTDLDYVADVWPKLSFDLWEETLAGKHYYTREVQAAALQAASKVPELADRAAVYAKAARDIDAERGQFWNGKYLAASLDVKARDGHTGKTTDLDSNVILAAVHSGRIDSRVLATARVVELRDQQLFPLNGDVSKRLGTAIGRYDGDVYFGGNPFYMLTLAFAELCYKVAESITTNGLDVDADNREFLVSALTHGEFLQPGVSFAPGSLEASRTAAALVAKGDAFVNRVARHAKITPDGKGGYVLPLPEQFDKVDGTPRSAP
ncbi:MAG TPA: glycoside hydrolase family 15 protein, partial [Myxococcota bacterium]|nr:glycoside hydrolase family 15 protein [Myxococcota bacterium]